MSSGIILTPVDGKTRPKSSSSAVVSGPTHVGSTLRGVINSICNPTPDIFDLGLSTVLAVAEFYNGWYLAMKLLRKYVHPRLRNVPGHEMYMGSYENTEEAAHLLVYIYETLEEEDILAAMWRDRIVSEDTKYAIAYKQFSF